MAAYLIYNTLSLRNKFLNSFTLNYQNSIY